MWVFGLWLVVLTLAQLNLYFFESGITFGVEVEVEVETSVTSNSSKKCRLAPSERDQEKDCELLQHQH